MKKPNTLTIYVEGGNRDSRAALIECQRAFRLFLEKAGLPPRSFRVEACASGNQAYEDFCLALATGEKALLLVDSEEPVAAGSHPGQPVPAWQHLASRAENRLAQPPQATTEQAHLMVPTMEAWFLADKDRLAAYYRGPYGREAFNENALPKRVNVEGVGKKQLEDALANATRPNQTKGSYHKGRHSFEILETLDPKMVAPASYHLRRLLCHLKQALQAATTMSWLDCAEFAPAA
ncbi:hypothetical protein ACVWYF_002874 [Hymenobacter sp. UYAg731]